MSATSEREVLEQLTPLIQEVTGARADQVVMTSCLTADLGAESIDLLDLSFLIEETFGITIEADEFERRVTDRLEGQPYEQDGYLTAPALAALSEALPEVPAEKLAGRLRPMEIPSVLTVAVFVHLIQRKLADTQEARDA